MVDREAAAAAVLHWLAEVGGREGRGDVRDGPGSSGNGLLAGLAFPDSNGLALNGVLSAEGAGVAGVLGDFHLLDLLTERGTISMGRGVSNLLFVSCVLCGGWRFRGDDSTRRLSLEDGEVT